MILGVLRTRQIGLRYQSVLARRRQSYKAALVVVTMTAQQMLARVQITRTITSQQQVRNSQSVRGILIAAKFEFDIHFGDGHTDSTDRPQHLPKRRVARLNQMVISLGLKPLHLAME